MKIYRFDFTEDTARCYCGDTPKDDTHCTCDHGQKCCCDKCCQDECCGDGLDAYSNVFKFWDRVEENKKNLVNGAKLILTRLKHEADLDNSTMAYIVGVTVNDYEDFFNDRCEPYVTNQIIAASMAIGSTALFNLSLTSKEELDDIVALAKRTYMPQHDILVANEGNLSVSEGNLTLSKNDVNEGLEFNDETIKSLVNIVKEILGNNNNEDAQG